MPISFWLDKKQKIPHPALFADTAEEWARKIAQNSSRANNPTQLRRFYDEVLHLEGRLKEFPGEQRAREFVKVLPYVKMLNARVTYALARQLVSPEFKNLMNEALREINDLDDFQLFVSFFEAFTGFYKFHHEEFKNQNRGRR